MQRSTEVFRLNTTALDSGAAAAADSIWRPLHLFNLYRLTLAGLLGTLFFAQIGRESLGVSRPGLFATAISLYFLLALASGFISRLRMLPFQLQAVGNTAVDIAAIVLLMHASGGIESGLGLLLVVAVAGGSLLLGGRMALGFAAIATLLLFAEHLYTRLLAGPYYSTQATYTQTGLLGASLIAVALLAHVLARRIRSSEQSAALHAAEALAMRQLSGEIVGHLQSGALAVSPNGRILLANQTARQMLGPAAQHGVRLDSVDASLAQQLMQWRMRGSDPPLLRLEHQGAEVAPHFALLGHAEDASVLVLLHDASAQHAQAQQFKLAALGRLTASIAHEIRNPLAAISHAAQLLEETPALPEAERRLGQIIQQQAQRLNTLVENVLQLSRRREHHPRLLTLEPWLTEFAMRFKAEAPDLGGLVLQVIPDSMEVRMDPGHLEQILGNLCHNAVRHSGQAAVALLLELRAYEDNNGKQLVISDNGRGIPSDQAARLFEPFHTTAPSGVGLGLYIARELCLLNQARLVHDAAMPGACFRIHFAHD
jgi:two-component system sensor histidine kinase PilS (NtrC family)